MTIETVKQVTDVAAVGVGVGALVDLLPQLAAGLTVIWLAIRVGEWGFQKWNSETVKKWTKRDS